jgi:hypothetical protein
MKTLKFFFFSFFVFLIVSCTKDESKIPTPTIVLGEYVRLDITKRVMNFSKLNDTFFGGTITTPGNNIESFTFKVKQKNDNVFAGDYKIIPITINNFPFELKITPQIFATALGLNVTDLKVNDIFLLSGEAITKDGKTLNYNNLSSVVRSQPAMKQAYRISTAFASNDIDYIDKSLKYDNYLFE